MTFSKLEMFRYENLYSYRETVVMHHSVRLTVLLFTHVLLSFIR
jgi:hypothetical protein